MTGVLASPSRSRNQSSQIQVSDQRFFVTGVSVVSVNGQVVFVPQNSPFSFGGALARAQPDLVLVDAQMPALSGDKLVGVTILFASA